MRKIIWPLLGLLVILHHDFWFWDNPTLAFGWFPIGLLYHVGLSVVAAGFWLCATKFAWPAGLYVEPSSASTDKPAEAPQA